MTRAPSRQSEPERFNRLEVGTGMPGRLGELLSPPVIRLPRPMTHTGALLYLILLAVVTLGPMLLLAQWVGAWSIAIGFLAGATLHTALRATTRRPVPGSEPEVDAARRADDLASTRYRSSGPAH